LKELGVAFVHPFPQNNLGEEKRKIKNVNLSSAQWLIAKGKEFGRSFDATPIYVFEATNELWLPIRRYLHFGGCATATVSA